MSPRRYLFTAFVLLAGCGTTPAEPSVSTDADVSDDAALPDVQDARSDAPVLPLTSPLAQCTPTLNWHTVSTAQWLEPSVFQTSPNDGLLWAGNHEQWPATVLRVANGDTLGHPNDRHVMDVDTAWDRRLVETLDGLVLADIATDEQYAVLSPESYPLRGGVFSHDDNRAVLARCDLEATAMVLEVWDLNALDPAGNPTPVRTHSTAVPFIENERWYCQIQQTRPQLVAIGDTVYVSLPADGRLFQWDLAADTTELVLTVTDIAPDLNVAFADIVALVASPDGTTLAISGSDGRLRLFDTGQQTVTHRVDIGLNVINEMTFAPTVLTSPVAFSHDGELLAAMTGPLEVGLFEVATATPHGTLPVPVVSESPQPGVPDAIGSLTFTRDDRGVLIQSQYGVSAWSCPNQLLGNPPMDSGFELTLAPAGPLQAGVPSPMTMTVSGQDGEFVPRRLSFDGGDTWWDAAGDTIEVQFPTADSYEVQAIADDGRRQGFDYIPVDVR